MHAILTHLYLNNLSNCFSQCVECRTEDMRLKNKKGTKDEKFYSFPRLYIYENTYMYHKNF